jgi:hypothetical protein
VSATDPWAELREAIQTAADALAKVAKLLPAPTPSPERTLADAFSGLSGEERKRAWTVGQTLAARDLAMRNRNDGA